MVLSIFITSLTKDGRHLNQSNISIAASAQIATCTQSMVRMIQYIVDQVNMTWQRIRANSTFLHSPCELSILPRPCFCFLYAMQIRNARHSMQHVYISTRSTLNTDPATVILHLTFTDHSFEARFIYILCHAVFSILDIFTCKNIRLVGSSIGGFTL